MSYHLTQGPLYRDQVHALQAAHRGLLTSLTPPVSCQQGHVFVAKQNGTLECERCYFIPFGVLRR